MVVSDTITLCIKLYVYIIKAISLQLGATTFHLSDTTWLGTVTSVESNGSRRPTVAALPTTVRSFFSWKHSSSDPVPPTAKNFHHSWWHFSTTLQKAPEATPTSSASPSHQTPGAAIKKKCVFSTWKIESTSVWRKWACIFFLHQRRLPLLNSFNWWFLRRISRSNSSRRTPYFE